MKEKKDWRADIPETSMENNIIRTVCRFFGVERAQVVSLSRRRHISEVRQIAMYFIRRYSSRSYTSIGRIFGRNHTSAFLGCKRVDELCEVDAVFRKKVEDVDLLIKKSRYFKRRIEMSCIQSKKAKQILARSFDGGHICMENAENAVEAAEQEMIRKAVYLLCPIMANCDISPEDIAYVENKLYEYLNR